MDTFRVCPRLSAEHPDIVLWKRSPQPVLPLIAEFETRNNNDASAARLKARPAGFQPKPSFSGTGHGFDDAAMTGGAPCI